MRVHKREPLFSHWGKEGFRGNVWKKHLDNLEKYDGVYQVKMGKHFNKRMCKGKEYNTCRKQTCEIYVKQT